MKDRNYTLAGRKVEVVVGDTGGNPAGTKTKTQELVERDQVDMANPRVLLMDEPSEGLAPQIVAEVMATIRRLKAAGLSIVLVEQNPTLAFDVADDIAILNSGRVAVEGTTAELRQSGLDFRQHLGIY